MPTEPPTLIDVIRAFPLEKKLDLLRGRLKFALPELAGFCVEPILPGQQEPELVTRSAFSVFDPEGRPLPGDIFERTERYFELRSDPANRRVSEVFFRAGKPIVVSTTYLSDHVDDRIPPRAWETMVFVNGSGEWKMKYFTREAAYTGHAQVVARIRAAQRLRRRSMHSKAQYCEFCARAERLMVRRDIMTLDEYDAAVNALFDLADRTARLHRAYGRRRRRP